MWVRTVTRHSLPMSSDVFVAAILVEGMCAENREPWDIEAEVTGYFELVINPLKDQAYPLGKVPVLPSSWEVPVLFSVISCLSLLLSGYCSCSHLPSPRNCLPCWWCLPCFSSCPTTWPFLLPSSFNFDHQNIGMSSVTIFPAMASVQSTRVTFPTRHLPTEFSTTSWTHHVWNQIHTFFSPPEFPGTI